MELDFPVQPANSRDAGIEGQALELVRQSLAFSVPGADFGIELVDSLIPVFSLTVPDANELQPLSRARLTEWKRLIFLEEAAILGEVDYPAMAPGLIKEPVTFRQGPLCSGLVAAVREAETRSDPANQVWETSLLVVEGLYIEALWLRARGGTEEWLIPVPSGGGGGLEPLESYRPRQFERVLSILASQRLAFGETV